MNHKMISVWQSKSEHSTIHLRQCWVVDAKIAIVNLIFEPGQLFTILDSSAFQMGSALEKMISCGLQIWNEGFWQLQCVFHAGSVIIAIEQIWWFQHKNGKNRNFLSPNFLLPLLCCPPPPEWCWYSHCSWWICMCVYTFCRIKFVRKFYRASSLRASFIEHPICAQVL